MFDRQKYVLSHYLFKTPYTSILQTLEPPPINHRGIPSAEDIEAIKKSQRDHPTIQAKLILIIFSAFLSLVMLKLFWGVNLLSPRSNQNFKNADMLLYIWPIFLFCINRPISWIITFFRKLIFTITKRDILVNEIFNYFLFILLLNLISVKFVQLLG